jgi:hypothetical protein
MLVYAITFLDVLSAVAAIAGECSGEGAIQVADACHTLY